MRHYAEYQIDGTPITSEGWQDLQAELERLQLVERPGLIDVIRTVRQDGELADNPVLLEVMEQCAQLDRRIATLQNQLASAVVVTAVAGELAGVGHVVVVEEVDSATRLEFELVGPYESDAERGRVSIDSPVGAATVGRAIGDEVHVETPLGRRTYRLVSVRAPRHVRQQTG